MKAFIFVVMIGPIVAFGTGCAEGPYAVDSRPAKSAPVAPVPTRKSAIALVDPATQPAPLPTRKPTVALNEPIIILGTADGGPGPSEVHTAAQ